MMRPPTKIKHRHVKGIMNSTECNFYNLFIQPLVLKGEVTNFQFEGLKFVLAKRCSYLPDFVLTFSDGRKQVIEVKGGFIYEGSREKFLWAKEKYGKEYEFQAWQYKNNRWREIWI